MKNSTWTSFVALAWIVLLPTSWCSVGVAGPVEEVSAAKVAAEVARKVVASSLSPIREGGQSWISENDCLSCHRVSFQVWALNRAAERGYETDHDQLAEWNHWATTWEHLVAPERRSTTSMVEALTKESDTLAQLLLGRSRGISANRADYQTAADKSHGKLDWVVTYREHLARAQRDDGSWEPVGQLPKQKRPLSETTEVTTMWTLLALQDAGLEKPKLDQLYANAQEFLKEGTKPKSTEWLAVRLIFELQFGTSSRVQALRSDLLAAQHADGGWGWLVDDPSDALGTGIALYALARDGLSYANKPVQEAITFLSETQNADGSWDVTGTKVNDRDNVVDTASYWGTAWAAIALLEFEQSSILSSNNTAQIEEAVEVPRLAQPEVTVDASADTFAHEIRPLLVQYCNDCHAGENTNGLNFMNLKTEERFADYRHRFVSVVRELERGSMPPKGADQPTAGERKQMVNWLRRQLKPLTPPGKSVIPDVTRQIGQYVVQIYEDKNGNLWFGTMSKGAARYDGKSITYLTRDDGLPGGGVTSFAEDTGGKLWIGTQEGICRYDGKTIRRFGASEGLQIVEERRSPFPPGGGNVFADRDGVIWASMRSGVFRWLDGRFSRFDLPIDRNSISSHAIHAGEASLTLIDRKGNKWFTVDGYGVLCFDGKKFQRFTSRDGLCSNNVNDILQDKEGNLWFICMQSHQPRQTGDGGVCRFDGERFERFPKFKGLHQNDIYTIGQDSSGNVWIGATGVGVYRYDGKKFSLIDKTDRMDLTWSMGLQAFRQSTDGTIWLGFSGGLFRVEGNSIINVDRRGPWDGFRDKPSRKLTSPSK